MKKLMACMAIAILSGCSGLSSVPLPLASVMRHGTNLHALNDFSLKLRHSKHITATSATMSNGRVLLSDATATEPLVLRAEARLDPRRTAQVLAALHHHTQ